MKTCPHCGRPLHLWGGETCDLCDRDSNGIHDRDEPVGTNLTPSRLLFPPEEKGFAIAGEPERTKSIPYNGTVSRKFFMRLLSILKRRIEAEESKD